MEFFGIAFFLFLLVAHALSLECYSCDGDSDCKTTEVCKQHQESCHTTVLKSRMSEVVLKGCAMSGKPNNSISHFSGNQLVFLAEEHCGTDLCNKGVPDVMETLMARGYQQNALQCYSCSATDKTCFNSTLVPMHCARPEETCVDITSFTVPEGFPADEARIKGCGQLSHCQDRLGFHNQHSFYLLKCCNTSRCNNDMQDYKRSPLPLNGVKCYSCEGNATHGCSPKEVAEVQCQGPMTECLEASGIHGVTEEISVLKGCASPSWCDSPYSSIYKNLGALHSRCCTGDLCNNWIINGTLRPFFRSRASTKDTSTLTVLLSAGLLASVAFLLS
ncbi:urokinase plasminogen activator surface receptor-like [Hemicordylus capensis]|uniref:urokinase plasminogen activator surface receptor-like n=1 Tax=Hemicordylus capensis TaxID=884348 RepID=UPI0023030721|nr:urokinase plasminogen activator surface receptor-like [Hemicordylus capensis]